MKRFWVAWAVGVAIGLAGNSRARADALDLQGSWMSPCFVRGDQHFKKDLYIVSSKIYSTESLYRDAGCFDLQIQLHQINNYEVEPSTLLPGAMNVNLIAQQSFLTVFDSATTKLWDQARFCGLSDWDVGIPRDVTGRNCGGHEMPKAGGRSYDLYRRENYSKLWIGLRAPGLDGATPENRPRDLDRTVTFRGHL